ncbi:MAG: TraU family protein [Pseudomonadota bacterium]
MTRVSLFALLFLGLATPATAQGIDEGGDGPVLGCDDGSIFATNLISDLCWDCIFPIRIGGIPLGSLEAIAGPDPSAEHRRRTGVPDKAADDIVCICEDSLGVPEFGITISMWEPARLMEIVRNPGCSPILGGASLPGMGVMRRGVQGLPDHTQGDKAFYQYHLWAFPILMMLELLGVARCIQDGFVDLDVMYFSELDPTWNHDELAYWTTPEIALTSTLPAQSACIADAVSANIGEPIDELFWCAGSWGLLYPLSGTVLAPDSQVEVTSLLAARGLAAMHRRGLARRSMGSDTLCEGRIDPFMTKSGYELSQYHPVAEANGRHAIGEHTFSWGEWRNLPGQGDSVHLIWRWNDCCTAVIP